MRWWILRAAERYSAWQEGGNAPRLEIHDADEGEPGQTKARRHFWIYAATIGELNLAERLLHQLKQRVPGAKLVLVTDRALYLETYQRKFPDAAIVITDGRTSHARILLERFPPSILIIIEIPAWSADAPCRLRYPLPALAARAGTPVVLLNAWSYGYHPASRLEQVERALFQRDYLRSMRVITAQTDAVRQTLIAHGARSDRVSVTGNMKFDSLAPGASANDELRGDQTFLSLVESDRPCVVAGCIAEFDEQEIVISAFARLRETLPALRLVIAPRHPENHERMNHLEALLRERGMRAVSRSTHAGNALAEDCDCLILDTFGELDQFYAVGQISFVGRNHNVLEPLSHGVPVSVLSGWEPGYPSYPVFSALRERGILRETDGAQELARLWRAQLGAAEDRRRPRVPLERLAPLLGATARNIEKILEALSPAARTRPGKMA